MAAVGFNETGLVGHLVQRLYLLIFQSVFAPLLPSLSLSPTWSMISTLPGRYLCPMGHMRGWKFKKVVCPSYPSTKWQSWCRAHLPGCKAHIPAPYPTAQISSLFHRQKMLFPTVSVCEILTTLCIWYGQTWNGNVPNALHTEPGMDILWGANLYCFFSWMRQHLVAIWCSSPIYLPLVWNSEVFHVRGCTKYFRNSPITTAIPMH